MSALHPQKYGNKILKKKEEKCYEKVFVLNANLHSLNRELIESHPEKVVKHNSNLTECSYKKEVISCLKISKIGGEKPQTNNILSH